MSCDFQSLSIDLCHIHNSRVALRTVALSDSWPLFEATKNPLFNKHLTWKAPATDVEAIRRVNLIRRSTERGEMSAVSVVSKHDGAWMGLFRFQPHPSDADALEIGYWSSDRFWHANYGLEVGMMCVDAAFKLSNIHRVTGLAVPVNKSACMGMRRGGLIAGAHCTRPTEDGGSLVAQEFSTTRDMWLQGHGKNELFSMVDAD